MLESATVIETAQVPETSDDLAAVRDMFKSAPPMDGPRVTTGLEPGTPAPDFALPAADGTIVRLSEMRGTPVAVVFYPLDCMHAWRH
ncbi:redoxin domain-containing protein [Microbacterium sp. Root53]|uniref:redoxin domain-containing protein n=1 Tax=Microbacterium sp. Root53 TaxID=1736553 RepID=UPI002E14CC87